MYHTQHSEWVNVTREKKILSYIDISLQGHTIITNGLTFETLLHPLTIQNLQCAMQKGCSLNQDA